MDRAEKQEEIAYLSGCFDRAQIALCADYRGLTVAQVTQLRQALHKAGATGRVVKNTLAKRSVEKSYGKESEVAKFVSLLEGPTMVIFSEHDPIAPTKALVEFAKANEKLQIKGGWFEKNALDAKAVDTISKLPSREETIAKLLALINTPATQLLRLIQTPGTQTVRVIDAVREKLEKGS